MTEREKVIKGLAACMPQTEEEATISCAGCPYNGHPCGGDYQDNDHVNLPIAMIEDIRSLLKAQEARIMKLEEVDALKDSALVYIECAYSVEGQRKTVIKPAIYQADNSSPEEDGYYCIVSAWAQSGFYHVDSYGIEWRCWTSRPTAEQREAIPWN